MIYYTSVNTRFCEIILAGNEDGLTHLHLNTGQGKRVFEISGDWRKNNGFFEDIIDQIQEYFKGKRREFDVKINPFGTDYQKTVWQALRKIPYGRLATYKEIAKAIGNEKAARAVGMANSKNPIPLIIPCHRVIGAGGKLTGFAHGLDIKERLITFEKTSSEGLR